METVVYLIRHSEPLKNKKYYISNDSLQIQNEKNPLTYNGEILAKELSESEELKNISEVYSSNYVRAISTAKYIAESNNLIVKIIDGFGERKIGINNWDEYPIDFEEHQFNDENYKIGDGESKKETKDRLYKALIEVLNSNQGKRIAIVSHSTAMMFLLTTWCDVSLKGSYSFNGEIFFDGAVWNYLQTFKLTFSNNELIKIENISRKNNI